MKKQTQEQFLETIDGLLAINEQLRANPAEREAETAKLREALAAMRQKHRQLNPLRFCLSAFQQCAIRQAQACPSVWVTFR